MLVVVIVRRLERGVAVDLLLVDVGAVIGLIGLLGGVVLGVGLGQGAVDVVLLVLVLDVLGVLGGVGGGRGVEGGRGGGRAGGDGRAAGTGPGRGGGGDALLGGAEEGVEAERPVLVGGGRVLSGH